MIARIVHAMNVDDTGALEVAAGSKLFNVVVDSDETGKALLTGGKLRKRVTLLPLNKIESSRISEKDATTLATAAGGKKKARPALSLVGYAPDVEAAVQFVFG